MTPGPRQAGRYRARHRPQRGDACEGGERERRRTPKTSPGPSSGAVTPRLTRGPLDHQRGDGGFDGRDGDRRHQADAPHGYGAQDGARLPGGSLKDHLDLGKEGQEVSVRGVGGSGDTESGRGGPKGRAGPLLVVFFTCVTPCWPWPVASLGTAVMILAGVPVPDVMTLVVMMVMGDLMPGLLVTPGRGGGGHTHTRVRDAEETPSPPPPSTPRRPGAHRWLPTG